jgi:hypothetical protein
MAKKSPKDPARENRQTRIEQLKQKAKELTGGQIASFASSEEWPEDALPNHEHPPFDRDRHLPAPGRLGLAGHGEAS